MLDTKLTGLESLLDSHQRQTEALLNEHGRLREENTALRRLVSRTKQERAILLEKHEIAARRIKELVASLRESIA